jgi:uncharacterized protein YigE (DUF2233 family)
MRGLSMKRISHLSRNGRIVCPTLWWLLLCILSLTACQPTDIDILPTKDIKATVPPVTSNVSITPTPMQPRSTATLTAVPSPTPTATITPTPPSWKTIAAGITQTYLTAPTPDSAAPSYVYALRIDPVAVTIQVHYDQDEPHSIEEWQAITGAPIVINGGFFHSNNYPDGQIVIDGQVFGTPLDRYDDKAIGVPGLFAVTNSKAEIYALGRESYNPRGLRFDQAVECYPILLLPGGQPTIVRETGYRARRTVIALDEQGQIVILLSDIALFSLFELSSWLASSGAGFDSALNLDGGRSSGIAVSLPGEAKVISSLVPVPIAIAFYPGGN